MVPRERLGLFDAPAGKREYLFALAVAGTLFVAYLAILPVVTLPMGEITAFVPVVDAVVAAGELIIATKLLPQAAIFRSRALAMIASGFVLIALLAIAHALTFPGAFAPNGLFGAETSTTAWIMIFRRLAFPLGIIVYVVLAQSDLSSAAYESRPRARVFLWIMGSVAVAFALVELSLRADDLLPQMSLNRVDANLANLTIYNICNIALIMAAVAVLWRKPRSVLDVWLLVALAGWLIQSLLNLPVHTRFTLGWYALYLVILISHLCVLLALIGESNRVYARLVISTAARNREREARMMTMDAVAAAISHEVGQPLAAVTLNASATLNSLKRTPPDNETAIKSLRDTIDAGYRTFDVLRSLRSTYGHGSGSLMQFELNELVLETTALLGREFLAQRVSLQLTLDEGLPSILANRVQIHRVLVNLLTNAVEALDGSRGSRRIAIRTSMPDGESVLLEVSNTGPAIPGDALERIFDPFFTTKPTGTGLGLSLCSTIVEEHGGRLWATSNDTGATFHLQLRRKPALQEAFSRSA